MSSKLPEDGRRPHALHSKVSLLNNDIFSLHDDSSSAPVNSPVRKGTERLELLDRLSLDIQEAFILEDLLYIFMGIEGIYITCKPGYPLENGELLFSVSSSLDPSLRDLVERILPLGVYYSAITAFIEKRSSLEYGLVNHALCAAARDMLKDYKRLLSELEHAFNFSAHFSLSELWYYIQPTMHALALLYQLTEELTETFHSPSAGLPSESSSISDEADARVGGSALKAVSSVLKEDSKTPEIAIKGGEVLSVIYDRMQRLSGDPAARLLYGSLFRAAGAPYVAIMKDWLTTGKLVDPYDEFFVKESKSLDRTLTADYTDDYWEERYTFRDGSVVSGSSSRVHRPGGRVPGGACIPTVLEPWKYKVLIAGRYINVIRQCGTKPSDLITALSFPEDATLDNKEFFCFIQEAFTHANSALLQLLLDDQQVIPRLRTLKQFFLLSQSSYLSHFLNLSHAELRKQVYSASTPRLQNLLDLAIAGDSAVLISSQDDADLTRTIVGDLKITMAKTGLYEWLMKVNSVTGLELPPQAQTDVVQPKGKTQDGKKSLLAIDALSLNCSPTFPLSLVISRKAILRYQLLFRFLLHLKYVEQSLSSMWIEHKTATWRTPAPTHPEFEQWRLRIAVLRSRMLTFVQQMLAYATFEVIEPSWQALETKLATVTTVDQLLLSHVDFLDTCLKGCMLTSEKLISTHSKLMVTCSTFPQYASAFTKHSSKALAMAATPEADADMAERWVFLSKFEMHFDHWFKLQLNYVQLHASSESASLLFLVARLQSIHKLSQSGP